MGAVLSFFNDPSPSPSSPLVTEIHSNNEWELHLNNSKESPKLMVICFTASWSTQSKYMENIFNGHASEFLETDFIKIDVDEVPDVAKQFAVEAMPTFVLLKKGKEIERVVGSKKEELKKKIAEAQ